MENTEIYNLTLQSFLKDLQESEKNPPKGERALKQYRLPKPQCSLPDTLRIQKKISYDIEKYNFKEIAHEILNCPEDQSLQDFIPEQNVFHYEFSKFLRAQVGKSKIIQQTYPRFIQEYIGPLVVHNLLVQLEMQQKQLEQSEISKNKQVQKEIQKISQGIQQALQKKKVTLYYQFPPTMRVHPSTNPPKALGRAHRDAEFGHQPGELNFWMPVTEAKEGATLWCESKPGQKDFSPFTLKYGEVLQFWGCECYHGSGVNNSGKTRISFDFRIGTEITFDKEWKLPSTNYQHEWKQIDIEIQDFQNNISNM